MIGVFSRRSEAVAKSGGAGLIAVTYWVVGGAAALSGTG